MLSLCHVYNLFILKTYANQALIKALVWQVCEDLTLDLQNLKKLLVVQTFDSRDAEKGVRLAEFPRRGHD